MVKLIIIYIYLYKIIYIKETLIDRSWYYTFHIHISFHPLLRLIIDQDNRNPEKIAKRREREKKKLRSKFTRRDSCRRYKRNESIDTRRRDAESPYTPSIFLCIRQLFRRSTVQRLRKKREREKGAYFPRQKGRNSRSDTRARNARIARERRTDANTRIARYNALIQ